MFPPEDAVYGDRVVGVKDARLAGSAQAIDRDTSIDNANKSL
jgi:hypothetical protein